MQAQWNERFAAAGHKYGTAPNAFVREQAGQLPAGARVLVPGDGEGRNSVWLASQGHTVWAVDYAENGLAKAPVLPPARLHTQWADLESWQPAPDSFDAVVLTYVHLPSSFRQAAHRRLAAALRPGGLLLLEAFHPGQLPLSSGGPKDPDMLYTLAQLQEDFAGLLHTQLGWEGLVNLDEGPGHQGPGQVTRYIGRR